MPVQLDGNNNGGTTLVFGNNNSGGTDWTDWIRTGLAVKSALQKPSFTQAKMSPEMKQVWQIYINSLMDPAYKNLGHDVVARAQQQADRLGQGSWTSPKTFSGDVGYKGTGGPLGAGSSNLPPWTTGATNTYPGQDKTKNLSGGIEQDPTVRKFTPNMRQWEPASGFPMTATMPETDPNREVSLDPRHPLANLNPTGATGSSIPAGSNTNTLPGGMSRSGGVDVVNFAAFMRSQGVKDAGKIAVGWFSGGLAGAALAAAKVWWDHYQSSKPKGGG